MRRWVWVVALLLTILVVTPRAQFLLGGALMAAGYGLQDRLHDYDFHHHDDISPEEVWAELKGQNALVASLRSRFPRSTVHPLVALLVCMDARLDTNELTGDARRDYYVVRTAGSVLDAEEGDMLELAVANGVKVVVLTRHSDCAAEKAATDPVARQRYPALIKSVDARDAHVKAFLERPLIAAKLASKELLVEEMMIDTQSNELAPLAAH